MRAIIFILILAVIAILVAIGTGYLDIHQTRAAKPPQISADSGGVSAKGGQTPAFDVETGSVAVGTKTANVTVPTVKVNPPSNQSNMVENSAG